MTRSTGHLDRSALDPRELAGLLDAGIRPIPEWPGYYATAGGDILSARRGVRVVRLKTTAHPRTGHLKVKLYRAGLPRGRDVGVHRLVCLAWHGPPPPGEGRTLHADDDPTNNRPGNLRWGDQVANNGDRRAAAIAAAPAPVGRFAALERVQAFAGALGVYVADPRWGF